MKLVLVVVVALVLGGGAWVLYKRNASSVRASNKRAERKDLPPPTVEERTRDTMLAYLTQPGFAGTKVGKQVLGPVRLEMLFVPDREVYFSAPGPDLVGESFDSMVARFIIDPKRIVMAKDDGAGRLRSANIRWSSRRTNTFFSKHQWTILSLILRLSSSFLSS